MASESYIANETTELRKLQEDITRSISLTLQFYIKTNISSIVAWLFLILFTHYFLVLPINGSPGAGASEKYKMLELAISISIIVVGSMLNFAALSDIAEKSKRLRALEIATYDIARSSPDYNRGNDLIHREWKLLGDLYIHRQIGRRFVTQYQFYCFVAVHLGLAVVFIII